MPDNLEAGFDVEEIRREWTPERQEQVRTACEELLRLDKQASRYWRMSFSASGRQYINTPNVESREAIRIAQMLKGSRPGDAGMMIAARNCVPTLAQEHLSALDHIEKQQEQIYELQRENERLRGQLTEADELIYSYENSEDLAGQTERG